MNIYLASGTFDFLKKMKDKRPKEKMILMQNNEHAVLLHETTGKTVFSAPRSYEVIDTLGSFDTATFVVLNNIPLTDEDSPLFEYNFTNKESLFKTLPGFIALRVLRPIKSNTYAIITFWENEKTYKDWENSSSYEKYYSNLSPTSVQAQLFFGSSYVNKYYIPEESS